MTSRSIESRPRLRVGWTLCLLALLVVVPLRASWAQVSGDDTAKNEADFAFIGLHGGVFESFQKFEDELGVTLDYLTYDRMTSDDLDLSGYKIIFIQHLQRGERDRYLRVFEDAKKKNPAIRILSISGINSSVLATLEQKGIVAYDPNLSKYYGSSDENSRRFLIYVLATYMGRDLDILPPAEVQREGLYHPDHDGFFETAEEFLKWARKRGWDVDNAPRAMVAVHSTHLLFQQPAVVDALIREFEKQGVMAVAITDFGPNYEKEALAYKPDVFVRTCHSRDSVAFREKLGAPHLHSIFFRKQSIDDWYASIEGLDAGTVTFQITTQEILGAIEPQVGAGTRLGNGSAEAFTPIPERIEHLVRRATSWIELHRKKESEKRVAIIYYNRELGKAELMRGTATGKFLNAPRSIINLLRRMKEEGYTVTRIPNDEDELIEWMLKGGRQIGLWAPGELDKLVREGDPVLIPTETYVKWLNERVPEDVRKALIKQWGPPPGRFLVWENAQGEKFIVIPRIDLGNVILLPQPLRGEAQNESFTHNRLVPPPHNYIATYFWLEEQFGADALIHFGTHGSEFLLPGKETGLSNKSWPDIIMGSMPNINPWILNNLGEALPVKRRAYAVLPGFLPPPLVTAGISDELLNLHNDINKWETLEEGALREKFRASITQQVKKAKLDKDVHLELEGDRLLTPEEIKEVSKYLHAVSNETTPVSLHVLGEAPRDDLLIPYLVSALRKKFLDDLAGVVPVPKDEAKFEGDREKYLRKKAEEAVRLVIREGMSPVDAVRAVGGTVGSDGLPKDLADGFKLAMDLNKGFARTSDEIDNILKALDGRFVPPGPANSPVRNPASVPTGRNLYTINPEEVPSRPSWEIGKALIDDLLETQLKQKGRYPEKVGFTLSSFATFADYGVMESQILYLLGVEPVWDQRNLVVDVKLIPLEELGRPRIDIFIAMGSYYRDNLATRMHLIDKAIRLVAGLDEKGNAVHENTLRVEQELRKKGIPAERARRLAAGRMFGYPRGQYGSASYYYLVERSGKWDTREDLMKMYLAHARNIYTEGMWGEPADEAYNETIQGTEVVLRSWSRSMTSPLANKYDWYRGGSLTLAVKYLTGREPEFYFSDVRDPDRARMVVAEDALRQEYRVRLFNRKWIEGMMKEGYAGADQISKMVSNTMGWKIMRENSVSDDIWEQIVETFVHDRLNLSIREWFETENPYAFQELTEILLESIRKGYWDADEATRRELAELYARSVVRHGENSGLLGGGNEKLDKFIDELLRAPGGPELAALRAQYQQKVQESATRQGQAEQTEAAPGPKETEQVKGKEMAKVEAEPKAPTSISPYVIGVLAAVLILLVVGYRWWRFPRAGSRNGD